jgi:glycosyltransferase involved in cell wall biosynthesis
MIPAYNSGARLARTLESVLAQDPGADRMQIRVIDDASDHDDPATVVSQLAGDRVAVWRQPRNVGAPTNFTTCVQQAVGHWVHVLHSDDLVLPGFYEAYDRVIDRHACAMVAGRGYVVDDDEQVLGVSPDIEADDGLLLQPLTTIARDHPFHFAAVVVARETYEQLGGFDPDLVHANDWEMWTRIAAFGLVGVVDEPLALYRRHDDSDTTRLRRSTRYLRDVLAASEIIAERFDAPGDRRSFRREVRRMWSAIALEVGTQALSDGARRNGWANLWRSVALDPRLATWRAAADALAAGRAASSARR